jgi:hypothetical protein
MVRDQARTRRDVKTVSEPPKSRTLFSRENFIFKRTVCAALFLTGGCGLLWDSHNDLERICRAEARTIVHDAALWDEFIAGSNQNYLERQREFPKTGKALPEYVAGFEERFGAGLTKNRTMVDGKVNRDDIYILKNDKIVGQFVDFVLPSYGFGGTGGINCTGLFPELYQKTTFE